MFRETSGWAESKLWWMLGLTHSQPWTIHGVWFGCLGDAFWFVFWWNKQTVAKLLHLHAPAPQVTHACRGTAWLVPCTHVCVLWLILCREGKRKTSGKNDRLLRLQEWESLYYISNLVSYTQEQVQCYCIFNCLHFFMDERWAGSSREIQWNSVGMFVHISASSENAKEEKGECFFRF